VESISSPEAPAAPAVAIKILKESNVKLKPESKESKNYISKVAKHMGNETGSGTDFYDGTNYISKDDGSDYEAAIEDYLEGLGAISP
jgi:hypothetical protein